MSLFSKVSSAVSEAAEAANAYLGSKKEGDSELDTSLEHPVKTRLTTPPVEKWKHRPVYFCENTAVAGGKQISPPESDDITRCPIGVPFGFESELFIGKMLLRLRDVNDDSTQGETENYFLGRNRKFQVVVQGKFKKKIKVSDVLTGHEFCKPLKRLPHHLILDAAEKLICMLAPSTIVELGLKYPRALSILGATSQVSERSEQQTRRAMHS